MSSRLLVACTARVTPVSMENDVKTLKEMVKDDKTVRFVYYRDRALHYETDDGFIFPVPISDTGSATFNAEERAMIMMCYIRRHLEMISGHRGAPGSE